MVTSHPALFAALVAFVLATVSETIHFRRSRKIAPLAFGPDARPRSWTRATPPLRVLALTLLVWGFTILLQLSPEAQSDNKIKESDYRRVVILLDVSPSMKIRDGGIPQGSDTTQQQTRAQRGAEIVESILQRLYQDEIRFSVVAFYTGALTIVRDTKDPGIVTNIMQYLPITYAFKGGKTDLFAGLEHTFNLAKEWKPQSATVIMITDGDTIPSTGMPKLPPSISKFLVVGVGSSTSGSLVNDHLSRQNSATLRELAARIGGDYQDVNSKQLSTSLINELTTSAITTQKPPKGIREFALSAILIGGVLLFILPILLEKWGCRWKASRTQTRLLAQ